MRCVLLSPGCVWSESSVCFINPSNTTSQVGDWIHEKLTVATDESYRDPTNLQSKLQKHQAFEAELSANKGRVDSVCKVGGDI